MSGYDLQMREQQTVNTDPQRRCYNGAHASSEKVWGAWRTVRHDVTMEEAEEAKQGWIDYFAMPQLSGRVYNYRIIKTALEALQETGGGQ